MRGTYKFLIEEGYVLESSEEIEYAKKNPGLNSKAGGKCGWFASYDTCITFLSKEGKKFANKYFLSKGMSEDDMKKIIKYCYDFAAEGGEINWATAPFVFGDKSNIMGLRNMYSNHLNDVNKMMKDYSKKANKGFELHTGFGGRSEKGLAYEDTIVSEVITFITIASQLNNPNNESEFKKSVESVSPGQWKNISHIYNMFKQGALTEILNMYKEDPDLDLTKYVVKTGANQTQRNSKGQLFDKTNFEINTSNVDKTLIESGQIIADVTITTKTPVYISVKMKDAQLSGVSVMNCMQGNDNFKQYISDKKNYSEFKKTKGFEIFNNFCETFGLDSAELYNCFLNNKFGNLNIKEQKEEELGVLSQKLLGGNYWYVKPGEALFVPDTNKKLTAKIISANISDSGKTLTMKGNINGIKASFTLRTDQSKYEFPYRLFISINVKELINSLK